MAISKNFKKGKSNFKKGKSNFKKSQLKDELSLNDLKHDLENQIIKVKQKLELLQSRTQGDNISLFKMYNQICSDHPDDVAKALIFIDRINYQMLTEITCMNILYSTGINLDVYKSKTPLVVYRLIHKIFMLYETEFNLEGIRYKIIESDQVWNINYDILSAILLRIIQNSSKYCLHHSTITVTISENQIKFEMLSLKIDKKEIKKIFHDSYIGNNGVLSGKGGTGKGLYHAKKLAEFHNINIQLEAGFTQAEGNDGLEYAKNVFTISKLN